MSKKKEKNTPEQQADLQPEVEIIEEQVEQPAPEQEPAPQPDPLQVELDQLKLVVAQQEDKYLRLAAEYDNFRKRTQKEKEALWTDAKSSTAAAFLPVYDNLERALKQQTADEAYAKGVEMTMKQLKDVLAKLDIEEIPALGESFDPNVHNAVMHVEDESLGENVVADVFQAGFRTGEKVIRFAMVKVAN